MNVPRRRVSHRRAAGALIGVGLLALLADEQAAPRAAPTPPAARVAAADVEVDPAVVRAAELLRRRARESGLDSPDTAAAVEAAVRWARARGALDALANTLDPASGESDALRASLAGRLFEVAGAPAHALARYQRAVAADAPPAQALLSCALLLARGGWLERAAELRERWRSTTDADDADDDAASAALRELDVRIAAPRQRAALLLDAELGPIAWRARLAEELGSPRVAARLHRERGDALGAIRSFLDAGDLDAARELARTAVLDDATAVRLARATGERSWLERHLGARTDPAAESARRQLRRSLGTGTGTPSEDAAQSGEATRGGPGEAPADVVVDPRSAAARAVSRGARGEEWISRLLDPGHAPSLAVALALLDLGLESEARAEVTRWMLEPRADERRALLPRIRRRRPSWDPHTRSDPLLAAEECAVELGLTPGCLAPGAPVHTADELGARAQVTALWGALGRAAAGSPREAEVLFHLGRLSGRRDFLERARRLAPDHLVTLRGAEFAVRRPIDAAVAWLSHARLSHPRDTVADSRPAERGRPDRVVGWAGRDGLRWGTRAGALPAPGPWHLQGWWDERDEALPEEARAGRDEDERSCAELRQLLRSDLVPDAVRPAREVLVEEESGVLLFAGRGFAAVRRAAGGAPAAVLLLVTPNARTPNADTPNARGARDSALVLKEMSASIRAQLPADLRRAIADLAPPRSAHLPEAFGRFLSAARRREAREDLEFVSLLAEGDGWIARLPGGIRARFAPGESDAPPARNPAEVTRHGPSPAARRGTVPPCSPDTVLSLVESVRVARTDEDRPEIDASLDLRGDEAPTPSGAGPRVAGVASGPWRAAVTGDGTVVVDRGGETRWFAHIAPPLPGPQGFPLHARAAPTFERGPHRVGPVADARRPRVFVLPAESAEGDRVAVVTDRLLILSGLLDETPRAAAPAVRFDHVVRDLAAGPQGRLALLVGDRVRFAEADRADPMPPLAAPSPGAFELEWTGRDLWLLGFHRGRFWLARRAVAGAEPGAEAAEPEEPGGWRPVPLPEMRFEEDRQRLRITTLGRWRDRLLLLNDRLWLCATERAAGAATWRVLAAWPGRDPTRPAVYAQTPPVWWGERLLVARPWGVVEAWQAAPR